MDWGDVIGGAVGFLAGGGGLVAFYRARSQNRVDERTQLSKEQADFRAAMAAELSALRTQVTAQLALNDKLESLVAEQGRTIERLTVHDEVKTQQIAELRGQNAELLAKLNDQSNQIAVLQNDKAQAVDRARTLELKVGVLERENNDLRGEVNRLRGLRDLAWRVERPQVAGEHGETVSGADHDLGSDGVPSS